MTTISSLMGRMMGIGSYRLVEPKPLPVQTRFSVSSCRCVSTDHRNDHTDAGGIGNKEETRWKN